MRKNTFMYAVGAVFVRNGGRLCAKIKSCLSVENCKRALDGLGALAFLVIGLSMSFGCVSPTADGLVAGERKVVRVGSQEVALRWCPPGSFDMGSSPGEGGRYGSDDERPRHRVTLTKGFWIGETEVTQGLWKEVVGRNPSEIYDGDDIPVTHASWNDCQDFIKKLNRHPDVRRAGMAFALPTEAQWEYACRAGTTGEYGGTGRMDDMGWDGSNSPSPDVVLLGMHPTHPHPVREKRPNDWGLYDMHGNACEWCQDWFGSDYYSKSPATDPRGPASGDRRVLRSGNCLWNPLLCRSATRHAFRPEHTRACAGLRFVVR